MAHEQNIGISYYINEIEDNNSEVNINDILNEIENTEVIFDDFFIPQMIHYNENFTVKELMIICDYYGFLKEIKSNRLNKEQIIQVIVDFEKNPSNMEIVFKRQNMWFYMNELKNDKCMKKYVIWQ
jgi:hypothetical protein